jgi:hypothetical protein
VNPIAKTHMPGLEGTARSAKALSYMPWQLQIRAGAVGVAQVAWRRANQTVTPRSTTESASSQPPSIHWKAQNRLAGW